MGYTEKWRLNARDLEEENIKFTNEELNYLLDMVENDINDYEEEFGELHKQTLEDVYNKLIKLK